MSIRKMTPKGLPQRHGHPEMLPFVARSCSTARNLTAIAHNLASATKLAAQELAAADD
jgi:hypothetical protein